MTQANLARDHLDRIMAGLDRYRASNQMPAVPEPANDFEKLVNQHADLADLQTEMKELMKALNAEEREVRDSIATAMITFLGDKLKEGMNTYVLSNKRKLKFENKIDRKVDVATVEAARNAYVEAADAEGVPVTFDEILRVKYELDKRSWKKLLNGSAAWKAVAQCIVTKAAAPTIKVD